MNQYAQMAEQHWRRHLPAHYREIPDPGSFFSTLGEEAAQRIGDLTLDLAGEDPPGEDYQGKLGLRQQLRQLLACPAVVVAAGLVEHLRDRPPAGPAGKQRLLGWGRRPPLPLDGPQGPQRLQVGADPADRAGRGEVLLASWPEPR